MQIERLQNNPFCFFYRKTKTNFLIFGYFCSHIIFLHKSNKLMNLIKMHTNTIGKFFMVFFIASSLIITLPVKSMAQEPAEEAEEEPDPWADKEFPYDDDTLLTFFDVNQEVSAVNRESQERISETVEEFGLTSERFQQISRAAQMGATQDGAFTTEELEAFNDAAPLVTAIQRETQATVQMIVEDYDMSMQDYRGILMEFRRDRDLQQYVSHLARERAREKILEERRREAERKMEEERRRQEEEENN